MRQQGGNFSGDHRDGGIHRPDPAQAREVRDAGRFNAGATLRHGRSGQKCISANAFHYRDGGNMHGMKR